jgi:hypothetical protein
MRYTELNPVRSNMVRHSKNHPWSSYLQNANGQADALVTPHNLYLSLRKNETDRHAKYAALFSERLSQLESTLMLHKFSAQCRFAASIAAFSGPCSLFLILT